VGTSKRHQNPDYNTPTTNITTQPIMPLIDPVTMSSPGGQASASASPAKASLPIELLPTSLAPIFAHVHPALLLSAYYLRFPALVADPTATLLNSLAPLAVVQMAYAVICLPVTGGTSARPPARKSKLGGSARKTGDAAASARPLVR
jgi:phosphatidylinositol glycan class F